MPLRREHMAVFHNFVQGATASGLTVVVAGCLKGMFGRALRHHKLTISIISSVPKVFWVNVYFSQTLPLQRIKILTQYTYYSTLNGEECFRGIDYGC